ISSRPPEIAFRGTFGNWEMDTVVGKQKGKSTCLLVLTERLSRFELIYKMETKSAKCTVRALDRLQHRIGNDFCSVLKRLL
ncbi:MAG: IS30 family transposase, partial [Ruthenibacterium sp.]